MPRAIATMAKPNALAIPKRLTAVGPDPCLRRPLPRSRRTPARTCRQIQRPACPVPSFQPDDLHSGARAHVVRSPSSFDFGPCSAPFSRRRAISRQKLKRFRDRARRALCCCARANPLAFASPCSSRSNPITADMVMRSEIRSASISFRFLATSEFELPHRGAPRDDHVRVERLRACLRRRRWGERQLLLC
jgi:hypothetical protein